MTIAEESKERMMMLIEGFCHGSTLSRVEAINIACSAQLEKHAAFNPDGAVRTAQELFEVIGFVVALEEEFALYQKFNDH